MQAARGTALSDAEQPAAAASAAIPPRRRKLGLFSATAAFAVAADVISKVLVVANIDPVAPTRILGGAVYLALTRNSGAAFSVGTSATIVFTAIALVIVAVIVRAARQLRSSAWAIALGLVLGGAVGNLIDRFLRHPGWGRGHVVDWISLFADDGHVWPIFNLADSAIDCGGVLAALLLLRGIGFDGRRTGRSKAAVASSGDRDSP